MIKNVKSINLTKCKSISVNSDGSPLFIFRVKWTDNSSNLGSRSHSFTFLATLIVVSNRSKLMTASYGTHRAKNYVMRNLQIVIASSSRLPRSRFKQVARVVLRIICKVNTYLKMISEGKNSRLTKSVIPRRQICQGPI